MWGPACCDMVQKKFPLQQLMERNCEGSVFLLHSLARVNFSHGRGKEDKEDETCPICAHTRDTHILSRVRSFRFSSQLIATTVLRRSFPARSLSLTTSSYRRIIVTADWARSVHIRSERRPMFRCPQQAPPNFRHTCGTVATTTPHLTASCLSCRYSA